MAWVGLPWSENGFPAGMMLVGLIGTVTALVALWLFVGPSNAPAHAPTNEHIVVPASRLAVLDGATLRVGDQVVQLEGIVAPARGSPCRTAAGAAVDCGSAAANALAALVRDAPLDCTIRDRDTAGRPVAACQSAGVPLSETLLREGWAWVQDATPSSGLRQAQDGARVAGHGLWRNQTAP